MSNLKWKMKERPCALFDAYARYGTLEESVSTILS